MLHCVKQFCHAIGIWFNGDCKKRLNTKIIQFRDLSGDPLGVGQFVPLFLPY